MSFYSIPTTLLELFIPEIFFLFSLILLILYGGYKYLISSSLTFIMNKISLCILFMLLVLLGHTFLLNNHFELIDFNFLLILKLLIVVVVTVLVIFSEIYVIGRFEFSLLLLLSCLGFLLLVMSFDLVLLYIAIEIQSISFYILSSLKRNSSYSTEAGLKYFILGALASGLFLYGCSLIYGLTGTLNLKELSFLFVESKSTDFLLLIGTLCILISLCFKCGVAPFHIWSPDVYEGSPTIVTSFFSVAPKLGLIIVLIRFFNEVFVDLDFVTYWWEIFGLGFALLSIYIGSILSIQQFRVKRLLAYSAVGHMGYIFLAIFSGSLEGVHSVLFYLIVYILTNFCIWSSLLSLSKIRFISDLKELTYTNFFLSSVLLLSFFSLAGVPPLVGFLSKFFVFLSVIDSELYFIVFISIFLSVISAFYYLRLIKILFFEKLEGWSFNTFGKSSSPRASFIYLSISFFIIISLFFFVFPLPLSLFSYYLSLSF